MKKIYRWDLMSGNFRSNTKVVYGIKRGVSRFSLTLMVMFGLLWSRVFFLQIVLGRSMTQKADSNRMEVVSVLPDRGVIKDRKGLVLARNGLNEAKKMVREYPQGMAVSNVIGYLSEGVGKTGIEKTYEEELRGISGEDLKEENAKGEVMNTIRQKETVVGSEIRLTIDADLSKRILEILQNREVEKKETRGAVVVSQVQTGEILALISFPTYDNNLFANPKPEVNEILTDTKNKPLFNRSISGAYPPGSIFKLITATAGLEEGKINEETTVDDVGEIKVGIYRYGNWYFDQYGGKEGVIGLKKALARSNDIYFYKVGEWVGIDKLEDWSKKFGLGKKTGIDLSGEVAGAVPNRLEKERLTGERWFLGNTYHTAIGQGDILTTPLQMNLATGAVVTGKLCHPSLTGEVTCQELKTSQSNRELILEGMKQACSTGGTAFPFFDATYKVACKTGTAQHGGEETLPHAWITVVIPGENERYDKGVAITVLLEEAGEGSAEAGAVARQIADFIVDRKINQY